METTRFVDSSEALAAGEGGVGGPAEELELAEMAARRSSAPPSVIAIQPSPLLSSFNRSSSRRRFTLGSLGFVETAANFPFDDYNKLFYDSGFTHLECRSALRPTKSQVLQYFAGADSFCINRINKELQITDDDGFPLFDSWVDVDFCNKVWRLEAYGRIVLNMREPLRWCGEFARPRPRLTMYDWNGDFFGALVPSDPFLIISGERRVVAKIISHRTPITGLDEASPAVMDGDGSVSPSVPTKPCWLCVLENSGKHVARLEDFQTIFFNKDVQFQVKLLALAAFVRLINQFNPLTDVVNVFKYAFSCCSSNYY